MTTLLAADVAVHATDAATALSELCQVLVAALGDDDDVCSAVYGTLARLLTRCFAVVFPALDVELAVTIARGLFGPPASLLSALAAAAPHMRSATTVFRCFEIADCLLEMHRLDGTAVDGTCVGDIPGFVASMFARLRTMTVPELRLHPWAELVKLTIQGDHLLRLALPPLEASSVVLRHRFGLSVRVIRCEILELRVRGVTELNQLCRLPVNPPVRCAGQVHGAVREGRARLEKHTQTPPAHHPCLRIPHPHPPVSVVFLCLLVFPAGLLADEGPPSRAPV